MKEKKIAIIIGGLQIESGPKYCNVKSRQNHIVLALTFPNRHKL